MKKAYNLGLTLLLLAAGVLYGPLMMGERILAGMSSEELGELTLDNFDALLRGLTFCHQAAVLSLAIFAVRLLMTLLELRKGAAGKPISSGEGGRLGQFLDGQGERIRQWSANCREARNRQIYSIGALVMGALILAWFRSRTPVQFLFVIMLPFGSVLSRQKTVTLCKFFMNSINAVPPLCFQQRRVFRMSFFIRRSTLSSIVSRLVWLKWMPTM